ncbi:TlpA family protein disulfide reductase [Fulvivirga lutimaris]|uniref:TlpA family protein disulfide reductase n=1 Tax=Fulvivirga lutimaris TaxID=1819566 RepID=UPI0012BB6A3C|nr:TlpA disulfide reductase family protein [Fulvivirga lutimaris]
MKLKIITFSVLSIFIILLIGLIFWKQEYKFTLPTPKPANYVEVLQGDSIDIQYTTEKPTYYHFYNYDCPCSRFNIKEFESLVHKYKNDVKFYAVIETDDVLSDDVNNFLEKYDLGIDVIKDSKGKLATALGVYSTPQAVLIKDQKVYYKGNYNKARFCLSKNTKFAAQALEAMVKGEKVPDFPVVAEIAYGCELPTNTNKSKTFFSFLDL